MKIIKNEIRPIGYMTIELNESEIQSLIGTIEELQMYKNLPYENIKGIRGDLYKQLKELIN